MTLLSELRYTDPTGAVWVAPAGSVVDGASIPRSLWSFMGGPFEGKYRNASVLHDVSYDQKSRPWQVCDEMFYNAMRCSGVSAVEAGTMYYGLRKFGRHWKVPKAEPVKVGEEIVARGEEVRRATPASQSDLNATRDWIRNSDPSLQQINQRADAESH
jgi:endonuclease G